MNEAMRASLTPLKWYRNTFGYSNFCLFVFVLGIHFSLLFFGCCHCRCCCCCLTSIGLLNVICFCHIHSHTIYNNNKLRYLNHKMILPHFNTCVCRRKQNKPFLTFITRQALTKKLSNSYTTSHPLEMLISYNVIYLYAPNRNCIIYTPCRRIVISESHRKKSMLQFQNLCKSNFSLQKYH